MATQMVGVRLDTELVRRIDKVAEAQQTSRTSVIERAIKFGLELDEDLIDTLEGSGVGNAVERAVISGLIRSNFVEVLAKLFGQEVDPSRKKMIVAKLDGRKRSKGKLAQE